MAPHEAAPYQFPFNSHHLCVLGILFHYGINDGNFCNFICADRETRWRGIVETEHQKQAVVDTAKFFYHVAAPSCKWVRLADGEYNGLPLVLFPIPKERKFIDPVADHTTPFTHHCGTCGGVHAVTDNVTHEIVTGAVKVRDAAFLDGNVFHVYLVVTGVKQFAGSTMRLGNVGGVSGSLNTHSICLTGTPSSCSTCRWYLSQTPA